jgi:hypothetical protein
MEVGYVMGAEMKQGKLELVFTFEFGYCRFVDFARFA